MSEDHPLGLRVARNRTKIRAAAPVPPRPVETSLPMIGKGRRPSSNSLFEAFGELLDFIPELARAEPPTDPEALRVKLHDRLVATRDRAREFSIEANRADQAAWFIAALADDLAINTPWGQQSEWPHSNLVFLLQGRGGGDTGTKFFRDLEELRRYRGRDPEMLELAYVCLNLGFQGMHRQSDDKPSAQLQQLIGEIMRELRSDGPQTLPLSSNWQGADAPDQPRRATVPLWVFGLGAITFLVALHAGLGIVLNRAAAGVEDVANLVPPIKRAELVRTIADPRGSPPSIGGDIPEIDLLSEFIERSKEFGGVLDVERSSESALATRIVLQATRPELFGSGKAKLNKRHEALISHMAGLILEYELLIAQVTVQGHTDGAPVQRSNPFSSNQRLSEGRAIAVRELLLQSGVPENFVAAEGRGSSQPIDTNKTAQGRARNRRVEIILQKTLSK